MEQEKRPEIPPGTLYMLVLKTLARLGPMHGYGIAQHVHRISDEVLQVEEGRSEERRVGSDWSSDVCSSDLHLVHAGPQNARQAGADAWLWYRPACPSDFRRGFAGRRRLSLPRIAADAHQRLGDSRVEAVREQPARALLQPYAAGP